jgi:hypothetical protein
MIRETDRGGIGVPAVAWTQPANSDLPKKVGYPSEGFSLPTTAIVDFSAAHKAKLTLYDPRSVRDIIVGKIKVALAADVGTAVYRTFAREDILKAGLAGLLRPGTLAAKSRPLHDRTLPF